MTEKKKYTTFIAEDIKDARNFLIDYIKTRPELEVKDFATNGKEALQKLSSHSYDLLFLDIQLPFYSGIEVLEQLKNIPYVIFTTAYDQYAIKAFEIGAVDYLLKPYSIERFNFAVDRFLQHYNQRISNNFSFLHFKEGKKQCILSYQDIIYLSCSDKHTIIHTEEKTFESSSVLKEIYIKLPNESFIRIHRKYIINLKYFSFINLLNGQYIIKLKDTDETILPIGRNYISDVKTRLI